MKYFAVILAGVLPATAFAAPVNQVTYASLSGTQFVTFDDLPAASAAGTNYDTLIISNGVGFGERFAGQTLGVQGNFDTLNAAATGPLTVLPGSSNDNLDLLSYNGSNILTGLGPLGYPAFDAVGEGSLAVLFSSDQSQFGFQLVGGNGGSAHLSFFSATGSTISSLDLTGLADGFYGFAREGGVNDIRGLSIWNDDPEGIGFDNLKFDVRSTMTTVPEPSAWAMMIAGLGFAGAAVRRRRITIQLTA